MLNYAGHLVFIERFPDVNREVVSLLKRPEKRGTRRPTVGTTAAPKTERKISGLFRAVFRWIRRVLTPFS